MKKIHLSKIRPKMTLQSIDDSQMQLTVTHVELTDKGMGPWLAITDEHGQVHVSEEFYHLVDEG